MTKLIYKPSLNPKNVVITGGSRGLGHALASTFASKSTNVIVFSRGHVQPAENIRHVMCDVSIEVMIWKRP